MKDNTAKRLMREFITGHFDVQVLQESLNILSKKGKDDCKTYLSQFLNDNQREQCLARIFG